MEFLSNFVCYIVFVLFAAFISVWRHADDWAAIPFPRRFLLGLRAARNWWLAYSIGFLVFWMGCIGGSFQNGFPIVVFAAAMAAFITITVPLNGT